MTQDTLAMPCPAATDGLEAALEDGSMQFEFLQDSVPGKVHGKQLDLRRLEERNVLALVDHVHGDPPSITWQLDTIHHIAVAAGIESEGFALVSCSDEVNPQVKVIAHSRYGGAFDLINPGAPVSIKALEKAIHPGHDRYTILNLQHTGIYKLPGTTKTLLFGKVRGDKSHVNDPLRACCGGLADVLLAMQKGEKVDPQFEQLAKYAPQFSAYDLNDPHDFSKAMLHLVTVYLGVQTRTIVEGLVSIFSHSEHKPTVAVASGLVMNSFFKYDPKLVLAGIHIIDKGRVYDLNKEGLPVAHREGARLLARVSDY